jgi:hypothetical protein
MGESMPDGGKYPLSGRSGNHLVSPPLKTGATFTLVVLAPRLQQLSWDSADYAPGDDAEMTISGKNLGDEPMEMIVEVEQDGVWTEVEKVKAATDSGQSTAKARWKFPVPPEHAQAVAAEEARAQPANGDAPATAPPPNDAPPRGSLVACAFEDGADLGNADTAWLKVDCTGLDDETVQLILEREDEAGGWSEVSTAVSTVKANAARAGITL